MAHQAAPPERGSFSENDYIAFLDHAHQRLPAPTALIWDYLNVRHEAPPIRAGMGPAAGLSQRAG